MRLKSTVKHDYSLHLKLEELNNIPQLSGSLYCKIIVLNHRNNVKFQDFTKHVEIKNNKSHIDYELVKDFKLYQDLKNNSVLDINLYLEFYSLLEHPHHHHNQQHQQQHHNNAHSQHHTQLPLLQLKPQHKTKLGSLKINLVEFLKFSHYQTARYLLQDSKINSILKLSIYWSPVAVNNTKLQQHLISPGLTSSRLSLEETFEASRQHLNTDTNGFQDSAQIDSNPAVLNDHHFQNGGNHGAGVDNNGEGLLMQKVSEQTPNNNLGVGSLVIQDDRILEIINESFQIPWNNEYDEFSPKECIDDIFDKNGLGFKRNEEGMLLIDLYSSNKKTKLQQQLDISHRNNYSSSSSDDDDEIDDDGEDEHLFLNSNSNTIQSWKRTAGSHHHGHLKIAKQIDEKEIRPNLKSWKV